MTQNSNNTLETPSLTIYNIPHAKILHLPPPPPPSISSGDSLLVPI